MVYLGKSEYRKLSTPRVGDIGVKKDAPSVAPSYAYESEVKKLSKLSAQRFQTSRAREYSSSHTQA